MPRDPKIVCRREGCLMANGLWLRLYVEILDSRKVQNLPPELFKLWVNLMCVAKSRAGVLPPIEDIAWRLRMDVSVLSARIQELRERRLVDETDAGMQMHDWDEHQFGSDSSTERVREFRKRKSVASGNGKVKRDNETLQKRSTIVSVKQSETAQRRTETEQRQNREEKKRDSTTALVDRFHEWIAEYPNATKIDTAARDWVDLVSRGEITEENIEEVFAGLRRYKRSAQWAKDGGKWICEPSTFLRGNEKHHGRMWLDRPAPAEESEENDKPRRSRAGIDPYTEYILPWET